ncbi:MAG: hypothetical protein Q9226_002728, partial [Calogaya cf. arnoldii]
MQLSSPPSLFGALVSSILLNSHPTTPVTTSITTLPNPLLPSPTIPIRLPTQTPSPISPVHQQASSSSPPSSTPPYYSPTTYYTVGSTSSTSYLVRIQQTYLISGNFTSSLPTSTGGTTIDDTVSMWTPMPEIVMTGLAPGVADDGMVTDFEVLRSGE